MDGRAMTKFAEDGYPSGGPAFPAYTFLWAAAAEAREASVRYWETVNDRHPVHKRPRTPEERERDRKEFGR
jgi:hypothetical protein